MLGCLKRRKETPRRLRRRSRRRLQVLAVFLFSFVSLNEPLSVADPKPPSAAKMAKLDESALPAAECDPEKLRLLEFFLSPAASTEGNKKTPEGQEKDKLPLLDPPAIVETLTKYVEGIGDMYDRTGEMALTDMFVSTYSNGLPIYASNAPVQQHTVHALQSIFRELDNDSRAESWKRKVLAKLCDAFKACQAEQGRVIDAVYGMASGRDKSFREQVLMVVDVQKELVLENTVNLLNPEAWKQNDEIPQKQVPHITSSYRIAIGSEFGLRGIETAQMDHCKVVISPNDSANVKLTFRRLFQIDELCDTLVGDVNQQDKDADRLVSRDDLGKWAGNTEENNGFDSHSIFFDEDQIKLYEDLGKPVEENMYQPFLHRAVALQMLKALFLTK